MLELSKNHRDPLLSATQPIPSLRLFLIPELPSEAGMVISILQRVMGSRRRNHAAGRSEYSNLLKLTQPGLGGEERRPPATLPGFVTTSGE